MGPTLPSVQPRSKIATSEPPCYENRAVVSSQPTQTSFCAFCASLWLAILCGNIPATRLSRSTAMSGFPHLRRHLSIPIGLLILACLFIEGTRAQQITQQPAQRPRRVGGSEQTTEAKKTPDEVDEGDVIRTDTQLVSVPAVVTDASGRPLSNLKAENFRIIEDGQAQTIANFGTTETPFEIALLLDTSGSTRDDVALIRSAANSFIQALRPGDRVGIVSFNQSAGFGDPIATVEVLSPLTDDREALRTAIDNLGASQGTPYYDALERIADSIFHDPPKEDVLGRRAVVALTDGVDSSSNSDFVNAKMKLARANFILALTKFELLEESTPSVKATTARLPRTSSFGGSWKMLS